MQGDTEVACVDVRAEILDLKLRVETLEATMRLGEAASREERGREEGLLGEINDRTKHLQSEIAAIRAGMATSRVEVAEQFAAVETEVAAIRREVNTRLAGTEADDTWIRTEIADQFASVRSEIEQEFGSVRSEMTDLGIKLDRLLQESA
ncbi:hypothetical protein [Nonomuraea jiangxiensis]|uniref:Uncharacterized protein n=1 Tax=Nonomuraea jiangxiensis TaxID=633440 RepID=A0A1G8WSY0_9ACTN|nr:hypothetical protein [Nonomuraea jiangxiensis]SDJ80710.1 hypothetical protein SAMN05421869_112244 [Nonomuraea jiangxiensis]